MPPGGMIIGVDLAPIKPIPKCTTFQSDITTDKCRATIRSHLKTWKVDTVLHDGAPNVGTAWVQDAFTQSELVLQSLRLATDFLVPGGTFITKIFRSKDYNSLMWVFNQLFEKVEATKPPSSRNVSAEIFVVCLRYKAPKRIDPRFLDPKAVFAELAAPAPNNEAKVFNPEIKKRKRDGYEDGNYIQFKEAPVSEYIQTTDPIAMLGGLNKLSFDQTPNGDLALAALDKLPETTQEVRDCCKDLKVLGRKEFKVLLRWRLKVRDTFGFSEKAKKDAEAAASEEVAEVEPMDEELQMQEEMQKLRDQSDTKKRKDRRRDNDRKRKEIIRMQMNMTTPTDIGLDQAGPYGEDSMFALKTVEKSEAPKKIINGRMHTIIPKEDSDSEEVEDDEEGDNLEGQLDNMYEQYVEKRAAVDAKYRAKKARKEHKLDDDPFEGFSDREGHSDDDIIPDDASDYSSDDEQGPKNALFHRTTSDDQVEDGVSRRAAMFFDQDIFKGISGLDTSTHDDSGIDMEDSDDESIPKPSVEPIQKPSKPDSKPTPRTKKSSSSDIEYISQRSPTPEDWLEEHANRPTRPNIDIITAEAMTLAHTLATSAHSRTGLIDDSFNRYSFRDVDGLPAWFLDDEGSHSKMQRPITAAGAAAIKEKLRALNARPIKKVREAQARKKFKVAQRFEKLKKKSALLMDEGNEDMSEREKAKTIAQMMSKAKGGKPKKPIQVVVAGKGKHRGAGRPGGVKGKYKLVDARMKKERRAERRIAKKKR